MDIVCLLRGRGGSATKTEIEGEPEWATHSGNTSDDVGAIDWAAVPSISGSVRSFDPNTGDGATVIGSDGDSFVQEAVEVFNSDSLVIALRSDMDADSE